MADSGPEVAAAGAPGAAAGYPAEPGAPKSREERLRDFYAQRQPPQRQVAQVAEPRKPSAEESEEALRRRKRGNDLYEARDFEGAVEHYTSAIKAAPSSLLHSNRAAAYMMLGWWDQAYRDTKAALRREPGNEKALERHGKVCLARDDLDGALEAAARLEAAAPEEEERKETAAVRRLRWVAERARDPRSLDECRAVLAEFGSQAELVSPLGLRLRKALSKALLERSDAVDHQRKIRPALAVNRRTDQDADEIQEITPYAEEALRVTAELLEDDPENADLRYWRGRALVRLGRHAEAEQQLEKGLQHAPEHPQLRELAETLDSLHDIKSRGNAAYKEGRLSEAIQLYTMGLDQDPTCVDTRSCATLYFNRSAAYRKRGDFEQALEDANMALVLHPKWTKALYRRGVLLLELGRYSEALTELKVVQRADPTFDDDMEDWLRRAHHWMSKPRGAHNYYSFMRLPMDAAPEEVKKQYKRLCLLWHPDKSGGTEEMRQRFEDLQEAYRFLSDEGRREEYDFGIWRGKEVRHHVRRREKVKDSFDDAAKAEESGVSMRELQANNLLDEKVECIYWGESGCPDWLQRKREEFKRQMQRRASAS